MDTLEEKFSKLPQWLNLEQSDHMDEPIELTTEGQVPAWISGSLYRNGSGLYKVGKTAWNHVFDGFAVIQRWTIHDSKISYQSSILDSDFYKTSANQNRIIGFNFGTNIPDPCKTLFGRLMSKFVPDHPSKLDNTAVHVIEFGDRLFALTETPVINEITPDTLKVKGKTVVPDLIAVHLGTAHPHILKDGSMIYFGTNMNFNKAYNFVHISPQPTDSKTPFAETRIVATAPSRWKMNIGYTHSFGVTENYFIQLELPLALNLPSFAVMGLKGNSVADAFINHVGEPVQFLVINRKTGQKTNITYKAPTGFVFHVINSYEESGHVICDVCFYEGDAAQILNLYLDYFNDEDTKLDKTSASYFSRFVLPLSLDGAQEGTNFVTLPGTIATAVLEKGSKTVVCVTPEKYEGSPSAEMPRINDSYDSHKYRYFYSITVSGKPMISKFDVERKTWLTYSVEEGYTTGEPVFLPRPGAIEEDDGVVLNTIVANNLQAQSYLVVLDAKSFKEIARAKLPKNFKMSMTYHGTFVDKIVGIKKN